MLVKPLVRPIVRAIAGNPTASLGSGFSPTSLFADGSKGVVYDNNDLSSFFLDSALTTPATVNGLVGGQLDKSGNGFHRTQAATGSKPVLRGTPIGSNLVTNGDFASGTTGWSGLNSATVSNASGVLRITYNAVANPGASFSGFTPVIGKVYRLTYTIVASTGGTIQPYIGGAGGATKTTTGTFVEYLTATTTATFQIINFGNTGTFDIDNIEIVDVSAGSVTAPYGLQYDAVDDFMQTAAVDFTATDKMFVCAGVRKLSDAALGVLVESSTSVFVNPGAFWIAAPDSAAANVQFNVRGTVNSSIVRTGLTSPVLMVVTGTASIATDSLALRVNGSETTFGGDQGTGNFGNYVLYFGRRAGTSAPLNGLDFGMVICGKTLTSTQIYQTERYIAQRTGISL